MAEHPYRTAPTPRPERDVEREPRAGLVIPLLVIWIASVGRVSMAICRDEPFGFEPTLAALIVTSPALVCVNRIGWSGAVAAAEQRERDVASAEVSCDDSGDR